MSLYPLAWLLTIQWNLCQPQRFIFPPEITQTKLCPDLVLWSNSCQILIVDLTTHRLFLQKLGPGVSRWSGRSGIFGKFTTRIFNEDRPGERSSTLHLAAEHYGPLNDLVSPMGSGSGPTCWSDQPAVSLPQLRVYNVKRRQILTSCSFESYPINRM